MINPHDPEWTEEHQKASEPTEYKPDWDSIPKEFKYCYYFAHALTEGDRQLILSVNPIPRHDRNEHMKRADRPEPLVDGAWYTVTIYGKNLKLVMKYTGKYTFLWNHEGFAYRDLIVHNRIPDELWNTN